MAVAPGARRGTDGDEGEERRVVTVLFADMAGSTALGELLDPEDLRAVQKELFDLVASEVEHHGGVCEKFVGDAVLAVFGVPQAHEDDAERAVRAALSVQGSFEPFARRLAERHGAACGLRIGINTGEVVAGRTAAARGELIVSGDAVNTAARLQQRAEPGEVLVGPRTRSASARAVTYAAAGAREAKGKRLPVEAWRALSIGTEEPRRGVEGLSAPLIGRADELAALTALARRAERERMPQLVTVLGPAGIGKSRLLAELVDRLPQATVLKGRCLPYGGGAYWPIAEMVKEQAGILDTDGVAVARNKLRAHVSAVVPGEAADEVTEAVSWTIGLSRPTDTQGGSSGDVTRHLHDAWVRYVAALGRRQLVVAVVEDLHWASPALLDLLEHLVVGLDDTAVVVVGTSRPELAEQRPGWGSAAANATAVTLAALTRGEATELVTGLLGQGALDETRSGRILARAEGNPFFVEEILQMLVDRGALQRGPDGWVSTDFDPDELPDSVHGVIASRIDLLHADARDALRRCSVVGRVFWPAAVNVADELVASLAPRGLVSELPTSTMAGMREFRFKHALTRDVAYASLPRVERRELHRRVGDWIQHVTSEREAETAELAAYHLTEAIGLGERDPLVRERALGQHLAACDAALMRGATEAARHHVAAALTLATTERERGSAQLALGRVELLEGVPGAAIERLEDALSLASGADDMRLRGRTLGLLSRAYWLLGRQDDARVAADGAVEALRALSGSSELAWALARRSQLEMLAGHPVAAEHAEEAVVAARAAGDEAAEANARINLLTARANAGQAPDAGEVRDVVRLALEAGVSEEAYRAVVNFLWSAQNAVSIAELDHLVADLRRPLEHVRPLELFGSYLALSYAAILHVPAGRWAEADRVVAEHPSHQWTTARIVWCDVSGGLAFRRGDLDAAVPLLDELAERALPSLEAQRIVPAACVLGGFAVTAGRSDLLARVIDGVHAVKDTNWMAAFAIAPLCLALARAGEIGELRRLRGLLDGDVGARGPSGHHRVSLATADGLLAAHERRLADAGVSLRRAGSLERALGRVFPAACIELELARVLEEAGDVDEAESVRRAAHVVLDPLACVHAF